MSPRSTGSLSDGEIISGDEEKAIHTTDQVHRNSTVNASTRLPPSGSSSRAARNGTPIWDDEGGRSQQREHRRKRSADRSRSPYRRVKSRSRSPSRANGEKRKHIDDHYSHRTGSDPRRFKVHYEGNGSLHGRDQASRSSYRDSDRSFDIRRNNASYNQDSSNRADSDGARHRGGSGRRRSRSPFRHTKDRSSELNGDSGNLSRTDKIDKNITGPMSWHSGDGEFASRASEQAEEPKISMSLSKTPGVIDKDNRSTSTSKMEIVPSSLHAKEEPETTFSEAEIIEQRRKRREAIKARHKSNQPLLVQALEQNMATAPATPVHDTTPESSERPSPPSSLASPRTPQRDSLPGSPAEFAVSDDEELINRRQAGSIDEEGPSAADYDPTMDMEEDRPDHKKQDVPETANGLAQVSLGSGEESKSQQNNVYDMFADDMDDDDDMFAPPDAIRKTAPTATKQARALDESLLDNWDYPDGHYRIILGELLDGRYAVQQQIGKGTFATVVRATDTRDGTAVAVKIACNNETMYKAGQKEMDMLELLNRNDAEDKKHIIQLVRHFEHKGHLCLVFENLSADLREVLKKFGRNVGINLKAIRSYTQQMFLALGHMKRCQILHADLKPDNILVSEKRNLLKVCDLGTASFVDDAEITPYLVSRFYRAPEVILGMPFDYAIDMWSIGCTLFELYTGRILFAGADNNQMLRSIQECRGKFPLRMLKRASSLDKHFDAVGTFYSQERDKITGNPTIRPLNFNKTAPGKDLRARLSGNLKGMRAEEIREHASFVDLMEKCLQLDPARRISPNEALRHSFVSHGGTSALPPTEKPKDPIKTTMGLPRLN